MSLASYVVRVFFLQYVKQRFFFANIVQHRQFKRCFLGVFFGAIADFQSNMVLSLSLSLSLFCISWKHALVTRKMK